MKPRGRRLILVPTDFSEDAAAALAVAIDLARALDAKLVLLHVHHHPSFIFGHYGVDPPEPAVSEIPKAAARRLEKEQARVEDAGLTGEARVVEGHPVEEIEGEARLCEADLIVMGTRGRTGLAHVALGSVAERTVQRAPCPVLTVKVPAP